jgi:transposase
MWYVGIDVHKKICSACIVDREGKVVEELTFPNTSYGIDMLLEAISGHEAKAVIESTGNLWLRVYLALEEEGIEVVLANPSKTRAIAEARIKTDKLDAETLAQLLRADLVAPCYVPPGEVRELRSLIRHRMTLVRDRTRVKMRVHSLLDKYEFRYEGRDAFGRSGIQWLRDISVELSEVDSLALLTELRHVEVLNQLIGEVESAIAKEARESDDARLLMTIPGVDFYTAMLFTSEVGDIHRFPSASKLVSWMGLAPSVHQSGSTRYTGRITKQGSKRLRWILVQAAWSASRCDDHFHEKFRRIARRRGSRVAVVAVARELVVAMYHMLVRREPYRWARSGLPRDKLMRMERIARNAEKRWGAPAMGAIP